MINRIEGIIEQQDAFFRTHKTLNLQFRLNQLKRLKGNIQRLEPEILKALNMDLGKSESEAFLTEIGMVYHELSLHIKKLKSWARPQKVAAPLITFPSKSHIQKQPYGKILIISPFNYPFSLAIMPLLGAISAGNVVVLKPSEYTIKTSEILEKLVTETFDEEHVAVVQGGIEESTKLLAQRWDKIFFTGSTKIGKIILEAAAKHLSPVVLELGGKNPVVVDKDANLKVAARRIVWGKLINAGQTCIAPDYLYVHETVKAEFLEQLVITIQEFVSENPITSTDYPSIVNKAALARLEGLLKNAEVYFGGKVDREKLYLSPTILTHVSHNDPVMQDEIFGPILPVFSFSSLTEVIGFVNSGEKPLAAYYFGENKNSQKEFLNPALQDSLFGDSEAKTISAFEPFDAKNELLFYPNSIKIDHDEEILRCKNVSSANYSNFRWDFGEGAEPRTYTGAEPLEIQLQELGFYSVSLTAFNSLTGEDETFRADSIIQCRYGKAYPCFVIADKEGLVAGQVGSGINQCEFTDTLYLLNTSYGAADEYIFTIGGNKTYNVITDSRDDIIKIPAFGSSILSTERDYNYGKQVSISLLQKHPERDTSYEDFVSVFEPTIAAFEVERINHFGREMPDDYYLINETEVFAHNKSSGNNFKCRWYVNGELKVERNRASDYSWMPEQPGLYELKLIIFNDFSADTASALFDFHLKTAVKEFSIAELKVYPTLCHNTITIQNAMEELELEVYDITGKIIQEQHLLAGQKTLDVSALKSGIYLFNFHSRRRQKTIKIVKQ